MAGLPQDAQKVLLDGRYDFVFLNEEDRPVDIGKRHLEHCTIGACTKEPEVINPSIRGGAKDIQSKQKMKPRRNLKQHINLKQLKN